MTTWGEGLDNSDKATNKAMSGAMKYALIELFCVPTQDVEDSDRTSPENGVKRNVQRTTEAIPVEPLKQDGGKPLYAIDDHDREILKQVLTKNPAKPREDNIAYIIDSSIPPLPPLDDLVAEAEASMSPKQPGLPLDHIEQGQAVNFERMFKDSLKPALRKQATALCHQWLKKQGIVDSNGEPTAYAILKQNFYECREEAINHAASLT